MGKFFRMRGDKGTFVENVGNTPNMIHIGDQIVAINGWDITNKTMEEIYKLLKDPPIPLKENLNVEDIKNEEYFHKLKKKQSTKSKLINFINGNKIDHHHPVCITFRRAILCRYLSPLILYREIKKVIHDHALSLSQEKQKNDGLIEEQNENKSYRKKIKKKQNIKQLLQQSGISAISSSDFRIKHQELFWNLSWHFTNLRLPITFLQNAFDPHSNQINTPNIDDLIHFVPFIPDKKQ